MDHDLKDQESLAAAEQARTSAPGEERRKLYVAGVAWQTTDDGFYNLFARLGEVESALVMRDRTARSRGFGFVTYKDAETADRVRKQSLTLDGRKLDLMPAVPKEQMQQSQDAKQSAKLYVAGISFDTDDTGLLTFFSRYGNVVSATVQRDRVSNRSRGFGFVTFDDPAVAEKVAQSKVDWNGRSLEIRHAVPRGQVAEAIAKKDRPKKIYVAGLSKATSAEELRNYFASFGSVSECYIQKDRVSGESRGFGFVSFDSSDSVDKVLRISTHKVGDKFVDCKVAIPKDLPPAFGGLGAKAPWGVPATFYPGAEYKAALGSRGRFPPAPAAAAASAYGGYDPSAYGYGAYEGYGGYEPAKSAYAGAGAASSAYGGYESQAYDASAYGAVPRRGAAAAAGRGAGATAYHPYRRV